MKQVVLYLFKYTLDEVIDLLRDLHKGKDVSNELLFILSQMKLSFIIKLIEAYTQAPREYKDTIFNTILTILNDIKEKYSFAIEEVKVPSFDFLRRGLRPIAVVEIASREYIVLSDEREKLSFMRVDSKSPRTIPERVIKEAYKILNERGELDFDLLKDRTGKYTEAALAILALAKLHEDKYEVVYDKYGYPIKLRRRT